MSSFLVSFFISFLSCFLLSKITHFQLVMQIDLSSTPATNHFGHSTAPSENTKLWSWAIRDFFPNLGECDWNSWVHGPGRQLISESWDCSMQRSPRHRHRSKCVRSLCCILNTRCTHSFVPSNLLVLIPVHLSVSGCLENESVVSTQPAKQTRSSRLRVGLKTGWTRSSGTQKAWTATQYIFYSFLEFELEFVCHSCEVWKHTMIFNNVFRWGSWKGWQTSLWSVCVSCAIQNLPATPETC